MTEVLWLLDFHTASVRLQIPQISSINWGLKSLCKQASYSVKCDFLAQWKLLHMQNKLFWKKGHYKLDKRLCSHKLCVQKDLFGYDTGLSNLGFFLPICLSSHWWFNGAPLPAPCQQNSLCSYMTNKQSNWPTASRQNGEILFVFFTHCDSLHNYTDCSAAQNRRAGGSRN